MTRFRLLLLAAALAGCADIPSAPKADVVTGSFGATNAAVIATDSGAQVLLPCAGGLTSPLRLEGGRVQATGTLQASFPPDNPQPLAVTGTLANNTLSLTLTIGSGSLVSSSTIVVYRNRPANFAGIVCLANSR